MTERCGLINVEPELGEAVRIRQPGNASLLQSAELAKAFAEPNRVALAVALRDGEELCGCDLSWIVGLPENLVSHHLGILRRSGATVSRRDGKMVLHRLSKRGAQLLDSLPLTLEVPSEQPQQLVEECA